MNILIIHNHYKNRGGEDVVVEKEKDLLVSFGHNVTLFSVSNDIIQSLYGKIKVALNVPYNLYSKGQCSQIIARVKPEIVHVHNLFPILSPAIYDACHEAGLPVVQTLHNYRIICPGALLMRDGKICEQCIENSPYRAVINKCYRNSIFGTLAVARMIERQRSLNGWNTKVDRYIALTNFAKRKFVQGGIEEKRIVVKPNFTQILETGHSTIDARREAIFVGRLSLEKGIDILIDAWCNIPHVLSIVGEGYLKQKIIDAMLTSKNINFEGRLVKVEVANKMKNSQFLVVPSTCYEGFPLVILEAFSYGLPVVCSNLGAMQEIVDDGYTGLHFRPGDAQDLADKCSWMFSHPEECLRMSQNARKEYLSKYTPDCNYTTLMGIYKTTIDRHSHLHTD